DREWYQTFQQFRMRLVAMLDELLPRLESDPGAGPFLLDGQLAVVDDYLEVRPEAGPAIRRLNAAGRLSVGPWYILMDEFLVSGETIVRNLQLGLERAAAFGGALPVGYLPDMFGHVAQMPQLLRQANLAHAVVWRGVPSSITRTGFWWRAPDGSTVRAEYLPVGYGIGAHLPADAEGLVRRLRALAFELGPFLADESDPILLMNGTDNELPQTHVPRLLEEANRDQKDFEFELVSLASYLEAATTEALPSWDGELRSGARANMLMGVVSNRVDVRVAAARAERALEHRAEPLAALWSPPERWPEDMLRRAWLDVIRNSAHDSICACSADEVATAVLHRYADATAIADSITDEALAYVSLAVDASGPVIVNPTPERRGGVVELSVAGAEPVEGAQLLARVEAGTIERVGVGSD
ncbi:MAG: alpha-mannosidase, partial [Acidimicrobiales bacterium]